VATLLAMMADNIEHVISYWVMWQAFHSPALGGFAVISHWLPFLLFSVHAGALADRQDCRRLIQLSQGLFMVASATWGLLFLTGALRVWHAVVILLVHGAAGVIGGPAIQLIIHDMVGTGELGSAIRLNASSRNLSILLGPAVGGGLMLALGPAWGLLTNVLIYLPLTLLLSRLPYTGHSHHGEARPAARGLGPREALAVFRQARADRRVASMIVLAGVTSIFVGSGFQPQMPEYAHDLGAEQADVWYSVLFAANAAGALLGALLLESLEVLRPTTRAALVCAAAWAEAMALFAIAPNYALAVTLLVAAGMLNITFTTMAQTLVQILAPPRLRGRMVGLFNASMLGLRTGSGLTVGVLGAAIGVHWSLALSATAVVLVALVLLIHDLRRYDGEPFRIDRG
jgi:MFS family permease